MCVPQAFRGADGTVAVYYEAAAVITVLVLLGQVMELRAREQTSGAIRALLNLAPAALRVRPLVAVRCPRGQRSVHEKRVRVRVGVPGHEGAQAAAEARELGAIARAALAHWLRQRRVVPEDADGTNQ